MPSEYIAEFNKLISNFIWRGKKSRLKRSVLSLPREKGGLSLPDIKNMIRTVNVKWLKNFLCNGESYWAICFEHYLCKQNINVDVLLQANFEITMLNELKKIPTLYINVLKVWGQIAGCKMPKQYYLWYNKDI